MNCPGLSRHTQYADIAYMMMTTGIHAAGNVDFQFTDAKHPIERFKPTRDVFGDINRGGIGQRTEIQTGAANNVLNRIDIGIG